MKQSYICWKLACVIVLLITAGTIKAEEIKQPETPVQKDGFAQATEFTKAEKQRVLQALPDYQNSKKTAQ